MPRRRGSRIGRLASVGHADEMASERETDSARNKERGVRNAEQKRPAKLPISSNPRVPRKPFEALFSSSFRVPRSAFRARAALAKAWFCA